MAKNTPLGDLSDVELVERLAQVKDELFKLRFQNATGQLDNSGRISQTRRDIARINTELRSREIAAAEAMVSAAAKETA